MSLSAPTPIADNELAALSAVAAATDTIPYFTSSSAASTKPIYNEYVLTVSRTIADQSQVTVEDVLEVSSGAILELASTSALLTIQSIPAWPSIGPGVSYLLTTDLVVSDYSQLLIGDVYELAPGSSVELAGNGGLLSIVP